MRAELLYVTDIYDSQIQFKIVGKKFNFNTVLLEYGNQIIDKDEEKYWTNATALHNATYEVGNIWQAIVYFSLVGAAYAAACCEIPYQRP